MGKLCLCNRCKQSFKVLKVVEGFDLLIFVTASHLNVSKIVIYCRLSTSTLSNMVALQSWTAG